MDVSPDVAAAGTDRASQIDAWNRGALDRILISLVGPDSHLLHNEPGVGSLRIGPETQGTQESGLLVDADLKIQWSELSPFKVSAGYPWPRWLQYIGNDMGVFKWAIDRPIETLNWTPTEDVSVNAGLAKIDTLILTLTKGVKVRIEIPLCLKRLEVRGDISLFDALIDEGHGCELTISPTTMARANRVPVTVPRLPAFVAIRSLSVVNQPCRQSIDLASVVQFKKLEELQLSGSVSNLRKLTALLDLRSLQFRYMNCLAELPNLSEWPKLQRVIAWNVDEAGGKKLRAEFRAIQKKAGASLNPLEVNASQLRKPDWFEKEHGLPFSAWPAGNARSATKHYRAAETSISKAENRDDILKILKNFGRQLNKLRGLETPERDDAAEAFTMLAALSEVRLSEEDVQKCFYETCDF